ncbi:cell surface glycoprotein [Halovivax sp.]|uniref:cell surface glycoprotein n=1 Tax=Halovivax sp. TaxID=1935978 RepID=UPI0025C4A623|nr:cell surface glycoprotein [Halovivax sp.]
MNSKVPTKPTALVHRIALVCLLLAAAAALVWGVGAAGGEYGLSTSDSTSTPTETVELDGSEFTISAVATAEPDGAFTATVDVPDGTSYMLDVYNDDEQSVIDTIHGSGPGQETVETDGVDPGTYVLALTVDGDVEVVKPLVVEGYAVTVDADDEIHPDDDLTATVDVAETAASGDPADVEVAIWNGDSVDRVVATQIDDGTYEATVSGLDEGDYQVYAAAQGTDTVMGEPEVLGISDGQWVTVTSDADDPGDDDPPGDGDNGSDDGSDENGEDGENGDEDSADNATEDDTGENGDDGSEEDRSDENGDDDGDIMAPSDPEDDEGDGVDDADDALPFAGPAPVVVAVALAIAGLFVRRRRAES